MPQGACPSCTPLAPALCLWAETCSSRSIFSPITLRCHQAGARPRQGKDHTSSWMRLYQVLHLACWHCSQPAQGSAPAWRCLQQGEGTSAPPILDSTFSWRKPRRKPQGGCCAHAHPSVALGRTLCGQPLDWVTGPNPLHPNRLHPGFFFAGWMNSASSQLSLHTSPLMRKNKAASHPKVGSGQPS